MQIIRKSADSTGRFLAPAGYGFAIRPVSGGAAFPITVRPDGDPGRELPLSDAGSVLLSAKFAKLEILGAVAGSAWEVTILEDPHEWRTSQASPSLSPLTFLDLLFTASSTPDGAAWPVANTVWGPGGRGDTTPFVMPNGYNHIQVDLNWRNLGGTWPSGGGIQIQDLSRNDATSYNLGDIGVFTPVGANSGAQAYGSHRMVIGPDCSWNWYQTTTDNQRHYSSQPGRMFYPQVFLVGATPAYSAGGYVHVQVRAYP